MSFRTRLESINDTFYLVILAALIALPEHELSRYPRYKVACCYRGYKRRLIVQMKYFIYLQVVINVCNHLHREHTYINKLAESL